ncbi:hypothetical protein KAH94_01855, partial [bacterium]|nr:hypothetical protein [bacterium]
FKDTLKQHETYLEKNNKELINEYGKNKTASINIINDILIDETKSIIKEIPKNIYNQTAKKIKQLPKITDFSLSTGLFKDFYSIINNPKNKEFIDIYKKTNRIKEDLSNLKTKLLLCVGMQNIDEEEKKEIDKEKLKQIKQSKFDKRKEDLDKEYKEFQKTLKRRKKHKKSPAQQMIEDLIEAQEKLNKK